MRVRNITTGLVTAALLVGAAPTASAAPTAQAPPCTGAGCVNQDPVTTGCDEDGEPVGTVGFRGRLLQGYYSPKCNAKWATVVGAPLNRRIFVRNRNGSSLFATMTHHVVWTPMVDGTIQAEACFEDVGYPRGCVRGSLGQALFGNPHF